MYRPLSFASAICFATISLSASIGFAQEFYLPVEMYSQSHTSYEAASGHYVADPTPVFDLPPTQVSHYESAGAATQTYGGFTVVQEGVVQEGVVQEGGVLADTVHGATVQGGNVYGDAIYGSDFHGQETTQIISPDYGYEGPGDMRTHLWNDHSDDLMANGVSRSQLDMMSMETVQKWHNFFHGSEGRPE